MRRRLLLVPFTEEIPLAERDRDLPPQQLERVLSDAAHDGLYLPVAGGSATSTSR